MMKNMLPLLLLICPIGLYGQLDTLIIPYFDCAHSHNCCYSGCSCCPQWFKHETISPDSLKNNVPLIGTDYSKTIYPQDDGLTYNQYVGETIAGFYPADGWRKDTINGGLNKEINENPYISSLRFEKQNGEKMITYRYENGKLFNGRITETLTVRFTPDKIAGHLPNGQSYYESKDITVEFSANCVNGLLQ